MGWSSEMESLDLFGMLDSVNWLTALLALVVCVIFYVYIQWANTPPGPIGLPYLGYYPFLRKDFPVQLRDMVKKYGEVFCLRSTGQLYVYLGTVRAIKEANVTKSDCFAGRSTRFSLFYDIFGSGVGFENGEKWKEMRKFFAHKLKDFGLGKKAQESVTLDFLKEAVDAIRKSEGENFEASDFFAQLCGRAIHQLLLGGTQVSDDHIKEFNEAYAAVNEPNFGTDMFLTGPLLKYVMMYWKSDLRRYRKNLLRLREMLSEIVEQHEKDFDENNIRDLVDCFIHERRQAKKKGDPKAEIFSDKALVNSLLQFIGDGGFSLGFMVVLVLKTIASHPDVQKEIQREVDDIVGYNRFPTWEDRNRMPYTNAAIYEAFRASDFVFVFPSLECTKETTIGDCRVPKGAVTLVSFWSAFHDPDVYDRPEEFDPTRFLPNEEKKTKNEPPVMFGIGKRSCIGEPLVLMEVFLCVTTILQHFDLHPPKEEEKKEQTQFVIRFRATPRKPESRMTS